MFQRIAMRGICILFKGGFLGFFSTVLHSTMLHLPPLRFHCVGGCWDRILGLLRLWHWLSERSNHSARSRPVYFHPLGQTNICIVETPPPPPDTLDALTLQWNNFGVHTPLSRPRIVKNASEYANAVCFVWWKDLAPPPSRYQQRAGALPVKVSFFGISVRVSLAGASG